MAFYFCGEKTPFCYGMLFWFKSVETILYQITPKTFELIELQCDSTLKEKFKTERIDRFYALLNK